MKKNVSRVALTIAAVGLMGAANLTGGKITLPPRWVNQPVSAAEHKHATLGHWIYEAPDHSMHVITLEGTKFAGTLDDFNKKFLLLIQGTAGASPTSDEPIVLCGKVPARRVIVQGARGLPITAEHVVTIAQGVAYKVTYIHASAVDLPDAENALTTFCPPGV
jgi:hypothetical protein